MILAPTDLQPRFVFLRKLIFGFKCITLLCFLTMTTYRIRYSTFTLIHFSFKYKGAYRMSVNISLDTAPSRCAVLLLLFSRLGDQHDHLTVTHLVNTLKKNVNTNKQNVLCLNCSSYLSLHYILAEQFRAHSQSPVEALTISLVQSPLQLCHVINPL